MIKIKFLQLIAICIICFTACNNNTENSNDLPKQEEILEKQDTAEEENETTVENFNKEPLKHEFEAWPNKVDSFKKAFNDKFSKEEQETIWALNRVDEKNSWRPDTLIVPKDLDKDWMDFSPFPSQLEILKPVDKFVFFSYPIQAFAVYENGILLRWGPTSMGSKAHPTPTGLHFSNWKSKKSISTVSDEWILPWNFNIANFDGVGWHEYSMPGYPASHSCLRLWKKDAVWLYDFAEQWILDKTGNNKLAEGTPVIVYGTFPFDERKPWLNMLDDPEALNQSVAAMEEAIQVHMDKIMEKQKERKELLKNRNKSKEDNDEV